MTAETDPAVTVEFVDSIVDAFNRHDVDAIVNHFAADGEWFLARGPEPHGRCLRGHAEIRALLTSRFERIPDMRWVNGQSWVSGNTATSTWTVRGKALDGDAMDWWGIDFWEFSDGKITKKDTYWKMVRLDDPDQ